MEKPSYNYDQQSDTLYISFEPGENATGVELNEHILLRIDKRKRKAVGMTLLEFSLLTQKTEIGPRSFPLSGLAELPEELKNMVIGILTTPPINEILHMSAYTPSSMETIPITSLNSVPSVVA